MIAFGNGAGLRQGCRGVKRRLLHPRHGVEIPSGPAPPAIPHPEKVGISPVNLWSANLGTRRQSQLLLSNLVLLGFGAVLAGFVFVEEEVFCLLGEEALGLVGEVFAALDGFFAGQIEAGLAGERT